MKRVKYAFLAILLALTMGCTTPKEIIREVPVEVVKEVEKKVFVHDSIHETDTVRMYIKGDTVFQERIKYKFVSSLKHDTLEIHDTVPIALTTTETKYVEKKVPQWWPVYLTGGILVLLSAAYLAIKYKLLSKLHI